MSKKSRNARRKQNRERLKQTMSDFITMLPSVCKGKTMEQNIAAYCNMLNKDNQFSSIKSAYTPEELKAIILL